MAGSSGSAEISKRYPAEEGLTARTTKQVGERYLEPERSFILQRDKTLID